MAGAWDAPIPPNRCWVIPRFFRDQGTPYQDPPTGHQWFDLLGSNHPQLTAWPGGCWYGLGWTEPLPRLKVGHHAPDGSQHPSGHLGDALLAWAKKCGCRALRTGLEVLECGGAVFGDKTHDLLITLRIRALKQIGL